MDKSTFHDKKDFKLKSFDWGKVKKCFRYKSFFNKMVDFWSFTILQKSTNLLKKLFYLKHFFTFPQSKDFNLKSFLSSKLDLSI